MYKHTNKSVLIEDLGLVDYQQTWDYQTKLFNSIIEKKLVLRDLPEEDQQAPAGYLLLCEHPHVYTLGKSGKRENLLINESQLRDAHATYHEINRGGDITYHGPGQLVGYPIFDLDSYFTDIHKYLRFLEEAIIRTLADLGITAGRIDGLTGVWIETENPVKARKICAMGVKASRWVTMHGFALNVQPDLSYFKNIIPCGIDDKAVTSISEELGADVSMDKVKNILINHIVDLFEITIDRSSKINVM
ncbi:lipoyl(octanoyl) transferase LipB [Cytophaga aurantiaca]|uniref:lipoyl(octanoyl) transferase LipB n=1 Tax=Cytophaga aurantiaca TaxID=29530 RepID=UPI000376BA7D|nr:lipoyl(octanoyl) transferase LipB [Cytophaga aurantiaca]